MPNGTKGDNPISDILSHGLHPLPANIEERILKIASVDSTLLYDVSAKAMQWVKGTGLDEAQELLDTKIDALKQRGLL
jgi:hypothetical protein